MVGAMCSLLVASCTSSPDGELQMTTYEGDAAMVASDRRATAKPDSAASSPAATQSGHDVSSDAASPSDGKPQTAAAAEKSPGAAGEQPAGALPATKTAAAEQAAGGDGATETAAANEASNGDATGAPLALASAQAEPAEKKSLFGSLFSAKRAAAATPQRPQDGGEQQTAALQPEESPATSKQAAAAAAEKPKAFIENTPAKPLVDLDTKRARQPVVMASLGDGGGGDGFEGLPGVRQSALFEIKRKSGIDDDSDIDLHEEELYSAPVRVASAAGLARLAPNGLLKQTEDVDVACLKPSLVRVLKAVERRYGKKLLVTSGYRDRARNLRARGAKNSQHMYCAAADIQVPGVGKNELASFLRSMPGRGGVGTYCHTNSVHVDIGPERDWNWRCRRRT